MMDKKELRQLVRQAKNNYTAEELRSMSTEVIRRLSSNPAVSRAQTILMYYSLDDEVDTHGFIDELVAKGKTVLLPVVVSDTAMELRRYTGPQDLSGGVFNIMEPIGEPFTDYEKIDVAVVPGMAFDRRGNRLGRGKGYYDRLLPLLRNAYKIGICFHFQLLPGVSVGEHDIRMDEVVAR